MYRNFTNILVTDRADFGFAICDLSSFFFFIWIYFSFLSLLYQNIKPFLSYYLSITFVMATFLLFYVIFFLERKKLFLYLLVKLYTFNYNLNLAIENYFLTSKTYQFVTLYNRFYIYSSSMSRFVCILTNLVQCI